VDVTAQVAAPDPPGGRVPPEASPGGPVARWTGGPRPKFTGRLVDILDPPAKTYLESVESRQRLHILHGSPVSSESELEQLEDYQMERGESSTQSKARRQQKLQEFLRMAARLPPRDYLSVWKRVRRGDIKPGPLARTWPNVYEDLAILTENVNAEYLRSCQRAGEEAVGLF